MTHDDPRDLADLLHDLADDAARAPRGRSLEGMAATARAHGLAARRRRTAARSLVAAASVAVVAVGGVLVAQNLGGTTTPPPATATTQAPTVVPGAVFPGCGAAVVEPGDPTDLRLVTDAVPDTHGRPGTRSATGDAPFLTSSVDGLFDVRITTTGRSAVTVGSTGYAAYVLVRDGVVVGVPGAMPEPFREDVVGPDDPSAPLSRTGVAMCGGPHDQAAGYYTLYTYVDAVLPAAAGDEPTTARVWGGPWDVRIGSTVAGADAMALECRMPTSEITTPEFPQRDGEPVVRAEVTPPERSVPVTDVVTRAVRVDVAPTGDGTYFGDAVETYLVRDGEVVSMRSTPAPGGSWFAGTGTDWPDVVAVQGATRALDGFFPELSGVDCTTGEPLTAGEYELLVVVPMWVPDYQFQVFAPRERVTLGDVPALPQADPSAVFPACGAPVPGYQGDPFELATLGDDAPVTLSADDMFEGAWVPQTTLKAVDGTVHSVRFGVATGVLTRGGRVVGRVVDLADLGHDGATTKHTLEDGTTAPLPTATQVSSCGSDGSLPDGTYEVWASVDVERLSPGSGTTTVVGRLATVALGAAGTVG